MLKVGMVVDNRYKILRELGRGGTSCVYLAENVRLHNYWAIKEVYKNRLTGDGGSSNMLITESSILTRLRHPGLPSIVDILDTPESSLIVMEYIEGVSLDKVLQQRGACPERDVIKWGRQLCNVLMYLHSQRPAIIYRDMKPANVMLRPNGDIVLIDFGMAREFKYQNQHDTTYLGTHGYAAPEQYNGTRQSDARADIYSLGVTLYHLVTGHDPCLPPYGINPITSINPSLSRDLDTIIQKCTRLQPEQRFQSARELDNALLSVGNPGNGYMPPPVPPPPVTQPPVMTSDGDYELENTETKRKPWWLFAVIPAALILIIVIALSVSGLGDDEPTYTGGTLYDQQEVYISVADERKHYSFEVDSTGYYTIYTLSGTCNPVLWLSDDENELIAEANTYGDEDDAYIQCWLYAGETYYIETTLYDLNPEIPKTGSFWIYIEYE